MYHFTYIMSGQVCYHVHHRVSTSDLELANKAGITAMFESLYDTPDFTLINSNIWLWHRQGIWILKKVSILEQNAMGITSFALYMQDAAKHEVVKILGDDWENKIGCVNTFHTLRAHIAENHWVDFVNWRCGKIGYYTIGTWETATQEEALALVDNPLPSKATAYFQHIGATQFNIPLLPLLSGFDVTRDPIYFAEIFDSDNSEIDSDVEYGYDSDPNSW